MNDVIKFSPVAHGMRLGLKAGLVLASVYALLGLFTEVGRQIWLTQDLRIMMLPIFRMGWAGLLPLYFLLSFGAALALGALTGGLIGDLWMRFGRRIDGRIFALTVLILCASIVVGLHAIFQVKIDLAIAPLLVDQNEWPSNSLGLLVSYPFSVGVPSILYVVAGAWGSYFFWRAHRLGALLPD